jgi:hypothetical protein
MELFMRAGTAGAVFKYDALEPNSNVLTKSFWKNGVSEISQMLQLLVQG